ncbi:MAG: mercury methylation ferredoxin HgcB [Anaerolineaceae bacterium]|jgi:NAD-dependent dihydropyrimidine dehydrogenase PreA subunit|nr:mercury methylation ferredoxin HgcB [Anaerolineaceae bacterium]
MFNSYQENTLQLNQELCNGCTLCVMVCPHHVFEMQAHKASIVNYSQCMECGACKLNCAAGAIEVHSGVGCASAMIRASLTGKPETCSCC